MLISFVIPCYRSAKTVGGVVETIQKTVGTRPEFDSEIILVNDCSPDNTWEVIQSLTEKYNNIVGVDIAKNSGQQCATMAGLRHAHGDYIATCDDDGQTPIETIFELYDEMQRGKYDVVCARYEERGKRTLFRRLGSWANTTMKKICMDKPDDIHTSTYMLAKRFIIDEMTRYGNAYPHMGGLLLRTTRNIGNVELTQKARAAGKSGYSFRKLMSLWFNGMTTFSIKPLRLASFLGATMAIFSFIIIIILVIEKFTMDIVLGWTSLMATNMFIGGVILLVLGVIGEYIGRIYQSINQNPQYVIREVVDNRAKEKK